MPAGAAGVVVLVVSPRHSGAARQGGTRNPLCFLARLAGLVACAIENGSRVPAFGRPQDDESWELRPPAGPGMPAGAAGVVVLVVSPRHSGAARQGGTRNPLCFLARLAGLVACAIENGSRVPAFGRPQDDESWELRPPAGPGMTSCSGCGLWLVPGVQWGGGADSGGWCAGMTMLPAGGSGGWR